MRCWRPATTRSNAVVEVLVANLGLGGASGEDGGLVAEVGEVGAGQPGGLARERSEVDVRGERLAPRVDVEDRLPSGEIRLTDEDLPIEATGAEEGDVEVFEPVRGGDDDDLLAMGEAVELDQELVQRLVVLAVEARAAATGADCVQLVDEDDRRRVPAGTLEQLADASGAKPGEHLDEGRGALGVEGGARGMGNRLGEQRLAGSGRAVEKDPLGHARAELREAARVSEEVDDLLELGGCVVHTGDVVPRHRGFRGRLYLHRPHARHQ